MLKFRSSLMFCSLLIIFAFNAHAGVQIGTITRTEGTVTIFSEPSKTLQKDRDGAHPRALFDGEYFRVYNAKPGDRVEKGNILRTSLGSRARVVYDNGDQFHVGPGSSYRISWDSDAKESETRLQLVYGKLRGIIEKGGPRSRLKVRTKSVTMGVRGTDFFIDENGIAGETEISILRGSVEVKPAAPNAKVLEVKSGFSATIANAPMSSAKPDESQKLSPVVELRKTTQEDLIGIQKSSKLQAPEKAAPTTVIQPEVKEVLQKLEAKAVETTLKDIKTYDPALYAKLETEKLKRLDQVNTQAVENLLKTAPKAPPRRKPFQSELEDLDQGAYEKYFKDVE